MLSNVFAWNKILKKTSHIYFDSVSSTSAEFCHSTPVKKVSDHDLMSTQNAENSAFVV